MRAEGVSRKFTCYIVIYKPLAIVQQLFNNR